MTDNQQHADLVAQVAQAHKDMTGEVPNTVERGEIQAVARDYLAEENRE